MITKKQIINEKENLEALKSLVEVYEEVAASRMQKVRGAVLQSRLFTHGLVEVFGKVRAAYKKLQTGKKLLRTVNGRMVAVLVTANAGLYGDIVDRTFEKFSDYVKQNNPDVVVLGKLGKQMMADHLPQVLYNYYDFADDAIDAESFEMIMRYILQFEKIIVFHGQFKTILSQEPVSTAVSGDEVIETQVPKVKAEQVYMFEPSVAEIAQVFEGEILASIFEQTLHEGMLAKFASRMMGLDRSLQNIDKRREVVRAEEVRVLHKLRNSKQLNTFTGRSLWS